MAAIVPAFALSEMRTAFIIGFVVFVPFLVIDFVVSATLMSLGMMMLPPALVSLPFKLLLFVLVDGWALVVQSLLSSFHNRERKVVPKMNDTTTIEIAVRMMTVSGELAAPLLLTALAIGLGISLIQSVTSIQEVTLTFVPKMAGVALAIVLSGHWMLNTLGQLHQPTVPDDPPAGGLKTPAAMGAAPDGAVSTRP